MFPRRPVTITLTLFIAAAAHASSPGTTGFQFLRMQVGARASAMGGTFVAVPGDVHALFYNPAGLAEIGLRTASLTYLKHVLDFHSGFVGYAQPVAPSTVGAVGVNYINFGTFKRRDESGQEQGEFGAGGLCAIGAVARKLNPALLVGLSAKFVYATIDNYQSSALLADAGILYHTPVHDLDVAAGVFNVGTVLSAFVEEKDQLPLAYRVGLMKRLEHLPLLLGGTAYKYPDDTWQWSIGGEFTVSEGLFLRWGYDSIGSDMDVGGSKDYLAGISLGFGLTWRAYRFDYSFSSMGEVGSQNRLTISGVF
ncbi:MAG: PorV/PorQ family protein [candidate division KSB1 bacterium]|nr:PorV/PorQ family protein [candidate division KSB1 bacterium]